MRLIFRLFSHITLTLTDDHALAMDSTLMDLYIKPCHNDDCAFTRIGHAKWHLTAAGSLQADYATNFGPGQYEMLVQARDRAGNALTQPYRMQFEIGKPEEMQPNLVVSPNPATSYLRFELKNARALHSIRYVIYDQRGIAVEDKTFQPSPDVSTVEWYWKKPHIPSAVYHYKVFLNGDMPFNGKVVLVD